MFTCVSGEFAASIFKVMVLHLGPKGWNSVLIRNFDKHLPVDGA